MKIYATTFLPLVAFAGIVSVSSFDHNEAPTFGSIVSDMPAPAADALEVALVQGEKVCVKPSDATLEHMAMMIVADNDYTAVRMVEFQTGWDAAEAGTVKVIKACAA